MAKLNVGKATKETSELNAIVDESISTIVPNNLDTKNIDFSISLKDKCYKHLPYLVLLKYMNKPQVKILFLVHQFDYS